MLGDERVASAYYRNAEYWVDIIRNRMDPYRIHLTDPALLDVVGEVEGKEIAGHFPPCRCRRVALG